MIRARLMAVGVALAVLIFLVWLLGDILMPFLVAAGLAYLFDPLVDRLQRVGAPRTLAVAGVFVLIVIAVTILVVLLLPAVEAQLAAFIHNLPRYIAWLRGLVEPWLGDYLPRGGNFDAATAQKMLAGHWSTAGGAASGIVKELFSSGTAIFAIVINILLIPVILFYLLRDWDEMIAWIGEQLPRPYLERCTRVAGEIDSILSHFVRGQLLVMLVLGTIYVIGLWLAGLNLALVIGFGAGLVSFVPYAGVISGLLVSSIAMLVQTGDPTQLIWVAIVFGIGQIMEQMVLQPLLLGEAIGLHPVWIIFAVLAGGQLFGFVGVLLALPVAAVISVLGRHGIRRWRDSRLYQG